MERLANANEARELDAAEWSAYFEAINERLEDGTELEATVEVTSEELDGTEAEWLPLDGITYEDGDDEIAIGLGGRGSRYPAVLWHFIEHPARVWTREEAGLPVAIGVESDDGTYTFIRLRTGGSER